MNIQRMLLSFLMNLIPIVSFVYIVVGIKFLRRRWRNGVNSFSMLMFACALYSFGYFLEINSPNFQMALLFRKFEFLGTVLIPAFGITFISELTNTSANSKKMKEIVKHALYFSSLTMWLLYLTNSKHLLFYKTISFNVSGEYGIVNTVKGLGYYLLMLYFAAFLVYSTLKLFRAYKMAERKNNKNSFHFLIVSFQIIWFTIFIILLGLDKNFDPVPATIMIMIGLFALNEVKNDMFEMQISRWKNIYYNSNEASFMVNKEFQIVCSNSAAEALLNKLSKGIENSIDYIKNSEMNNKPIFFNIDGEIKWFEVKKSFYDSRHKLTNYSLIDITNKKSNSMVAETFFNAIEDFVIVSTEDGRILFANDEVRRRLEYSDEEIKQMHILDLHPNELKKEAEAIFLKMLKRETDKCYLPIKTKNGKMISVETRVWLGNWNGEPVVYGISKDISLFKETEDKFKKSFYNNPAIMAISDLNTHKYIDINEAFTKKLGYSREEIVGKTITDLRIFYNSEQSIQARELLKKEGKFSNVEIDVIAKNGEKLTGLFSGEIIQTENSTQLITVMLDITERKKSESEIEFLSYHDPLTGLYNRRYYEQEIQKITKEKWLPLTLVMVDVNGLKLTNDAFGHKTGDILLEEIATILKRECREDDIVARIGGDEFILLLPETDAKNANRIIERINLAIANKKIDKVILSVSMGFAVKQDDSDDMDEIFKRAEDDMYRHKLSESSSMRSKTIDIIMNSLYEKSNREMLHSKRVSEFCEAIAKEMSFAKDDINSIRIAGLMHDIGKIGIDERILNKPKKLDSGEWNEIERHSEIGYRILSAANEFSEIADYVLEHHEKWNGTGYPKGLRGEEISLQARIIAVADAYDAMTSDRAYRQALSEKEAIRELIRCSGEQFDPNIVKVFIEGVLGKQCVLEGNFL